MLKLQHFGHLIQRTDSLEKTLMLGKIEGRRRTGWQSIRWLDGITDSMGMRFEQALGVGDAQGGLACCRPWGCKESDTTERLNWTEYMASTSPSLMIIIKIAQITDRISTSPSQSSSHCAAHTLETIFEPASTPAFLSHRMWLSDVYLENYACHQWCSAGRTPLQQASSQGWRAVIHWWFKLSDRREGKQE